MDLVLVLDLDLVLDPEKLHSLALTVEPAMVTLWTIAKAGSRSRTRSRTRTRSRKSRFRDGN